MPEGSFETGPVTRFLSERRAEMKENIERLREIAEEIDELFTEAIDIVSDRLESSDSTLSRLQQDLSETLEEAILEMENESDLLTGDEEEEEEIGDDEID